MWADTDATYVYLADAVVYSANASRPICITSPEVQGVWQVDVYIARVDKAEPALLNFDPN